MYHHPATCITTPNPPSSEGGIAPCGNRRRAGTLKSEDTYREMGDTVKIATIKALVRRGHARVRPTATEGHCACARVCAVQRDEDLDHYLPPTCAVRHLLERTAASAR
jgi:hypothetical protein